MGPIYQIQKRVQPSGKMTQFLPPNLLALFAPREPIPYLAPLDKLPHEKKPWPYSGVSEFLHEFEVRCTYLCMYFNILVHTGSGWHTTTKKNRNTWRTKSQKGIKYVCFVYYFYCVTLLASTKRWPLQRETRKCYIRMCVCLVVFQFDLHVSYFYQGTHQVILIWQGIHSRHCFLVAL